MADQLCLGPMSCMRGRSVRGADDGGEVADPAAFAALRTSTRYQQTLELSHIGGLARCNGRAA